MLQHTHGGLELWDIRKFTNILEGYLTILFSKHWALIGSKCSFLRRVIMETRVPTPGFWKALGGHDIWLLLDIVHYPYGKQKHGGGVMSCHLFLLLSVKLGLWSCWLWYQHPLWVLTVLTKQDSGWLLWIVQYCCRKQKKGEGDVSPFDLIAQC